VYTSIDQTLVNSLQCMLNCEIGDKTVMLLQQSIEHMSIVYTCNTYFVMHWSMYFFREYLVNVLVQYVHQSIRLQNK